MHIGRSKKYNLFYMNRDEVAEWVKKTDIVLVPLGSLEQHGPACPLSVDSIAALLTVEKASEKADVPHTPLVWTGWSPYHLVTPDFAAGTISLRFGTAVNLLYDIGRCLIHHGFNKIVYVSGHTGNIFPADIAMRLLRYKTHAFVALFRADSEVFMRTPGIRDLLENPPEEYPQCHASEAESSAVLAYDESLCKWDKQRISPPHRPLWLPDTFKAHGGSPFEIEFKDYGTIIRLPLDHNEISDTGIIGNPMRATKEKGEKIYDKLASILAEFIEEIRKIKVEVINRDIRSDRDFI